MNLTQAERANLIAELEIQLWKISDEKLEIIAKVVDL